jgi:hypothetical protein
MSFDFPSLSGSEAKGELILRGKDSCPGMIPAATLFDMIAVADKVDSVRFTRFEMKRLTWAIVLSLLLHLFCWGGYDLAKKTGLWQRLHWPARLQVAQKKPPTLVVQEAEPNIFLDVDPDQVSPDAPKDAKFYSDKNSRAANPDADKDSDLPKLTGKQTDVPETRDVLRTPNTKPTPPVPQPSLQKQAQPAQPKPTELTGDTRLAKLETSPEKTEDKPERPRTLKEAYAQQSALRPSIAMNQDGGVQRRAIVPTNDVKLTGFGEYDKRFYDAICQRWWDLLDSQQFARDRTGKVILEFHLNYDGTITDMTVAQNDVGDLLGYVCQKAVNDPAPYERFPSDMRLKLGNYSTIRIEFNYY